MKTVLALCVLALAAQAQTRPRILGVSHYAIYTSDVAKARTFYKDYLGYAEPYDLKNPDGSLSLTFFKINDRQYVELFPEKATATDRLNHVSLETDNVEQMRLYLAAKGVKVPAKVNTVRIGNLAFNVKDPDGHTVEFVQYMPGSRSSLDQGKNLPTTRISDYMSHFGILCGKLDASLAFYKEILGFKETWRGGRDETLNWVNIQVPDGQDYIELMLYRELPGETKRGSQHHICLFVDDIEKAKAELAKRNGYDRPLEIRTGINRRRQLNLFDHDGTRVELMEPRTIDGVPAPWSKASPPR